MKEPSKKPNVPKPPSQKAGFLGAIETGMKLDKAADNMRAEKTADMTFKMPPKWHAEFKSTAAMHGMSMKELLVQAFEDWKEKRLGQDRLVKK